jgi:hypothetical protein
MALSAAGKRADRGVGVRHLAGGLLDLGVDLDSGAGGGCNRAGVDT